MPDPPDPAPPPPSSEAVWSIVTCTWIILVGARVLYYALERARFPNIVPPVTADAVSGVLLWPAVALGCRGILALWRRVGGATAAFVALASSIFFGAASRLAYAVGTLFNGSDELSRHWLSLLESTGPGFLVPWVSNTVEYAIMYLSCIGLAVGFLSYLGYRDERAHVREAEVIAATERLRALRTQLSPHFLFNALTGVVGLSSTSPDAARRLVTQLGDLMRRTLRSSETEWHALDEEIAYVTEYLQLQEVRQPTAMTWHITVKAPGALEVPTLILLPLVENAVVHGRGTPRQPLHIDVTVSVTDANLVIEVVNTCERRPIEDLTRGTRTGLRNLRERLSILFGGEACMTVDHSQAGRWCATVTCVLGRRRGTTRRNN